MALFPPISQSPEEVRELLRPLRNKFSVALFAHQNAFSVGGIIRVAHSYLVQEIILIGTEPYYEKASMGMHHYETIQVVNDEDAFFRHVQGRPVWAVEKDHATHTIYCGDPYPDDVVLLFGSERSGLPDSCVARAHRVLGIPMYGVNHSFPVSVSVGIVLSEWARRKYQAGQIVSG